jgi:hypothetical protein
MVALEGLQEQETKLRHKMKRTRMQKEYDRGTTTRFDGPISKSVTMHWRHAVSQKQGGMPICRGNSCV